jgi:hypothetical protein
VKAGEVEDGRNPRRSMAAGEDVGEDCVAYRASRLDLLARGEPGRRGASSECVGAARGGLEQRRDDEVKAVVLGGVFRTGACREEPEKGEKREAAAPEWGGEGLGFLGSSGWVLKGEGRAHLLGVLGGPCREKKEVMRGRGARLLRDSF